jgi:LmbE family N-acetylglucosaminyl deacetylase
VLTRGQRIATLKAVTRVRRALCARTDVDRSVAARTSAVVVAPHQDDEVLGCGGTIILKRDAGVPVTIVFMGDGTTSHSRFMPPGDLHRLRNGEALAAAEKLGLTASDVRFLDLPETRLSSHHELATQRVLAILDECRPEELYVPYRRDGNADHEATHRSVVAAARRSGLALRMCEYPVWMWNQWPWTSLDVRLSRMTLRDIRRVVSSACGLEALMHFRTRVFIGDVLARKREALAQHRSQMIELVPAVGWPTLSDVSGGEFLDCFFQPCEFFHTWNLRPRDAGGL